jgi:hypothetical protein
VVSAQTAGGLGCLHKSRGGERKGIFLKASIVAKPIANSAAHQ